MRAVKQFKNLIFKKRSHLTDGILGGEIRIVHPPRAMTPPGGSSGSCRSRSPDMEDRQPVERTQSSRGEHGDVNVSDFARPSPRRMDSAVAMADDEMSDGFKTSDARGSSGDTVPSPSENSTGPNPVAHERMRDSGKEHAHDLLAEDPLCLNVGPGGEDAHLEPSHVVSESPPATDINVYETAYREEVERIRKRRGKGATVYLTRRVDNQAGGESDGSSMAAQQVKA
jgi:calcium/calmodulin-dependent protein kinase kinase 2